MNTEIGVSEVLSSPYERHTREKVNQHVPEQLTRDQSQERNPVLAPRASIPLAGRPSPTVTALVTEL